MKPGVRKALKDMTPEEMRRKGSRATRFYGRKRPPPGASRCRAARPAARRIAVKGRRLLERYAAAK